MWKCIGVSDTSYTWVKLVSEDSGKNVELDPTLTQSGKAADAKVTGDEIKRVEDKIPSLEGYAKTDEIPTKPEDIGAQPQGNYLTKAPIESVNGKTGAVVLSVEDIGAESKGTAVGAVSAHNTDTESHTDIRLEVKAIREQLSAFLDVDEEMLNELSELIARIVANQTSISQLTTSKINVSDIVNDLTTNVDNKPLSAAQGVAIKSLIDELSSGKLNATELTDAINTALAQAKDSGEFDGPIPYIGADGMWYVEDICTGFTALGGYYEISIHNDPDTSNKFIVHYTPSTGSLPEIPDNEITIDLDTGSNKTILAEMLYLNNDNENMVCHGNITMDESLPDGCLLEFELLIDVHSESFSKIVNFISYARYNTISPECLLFCGKIASCDICVYATISGGGISINAEYSIDADPSSGDSTIISLNVVSIKIINYDSE